MILVNSSILVIEVDGISGSYIYVILDLFFKNIPLLLPIISFKVYPLMSYSFILYSSLMWPSKIISSFIVWPNISLNEIISIESFDWFWP